jgi:crotonobetainyl-CoA:carnitine CoA-transferase CaiB-like acyl-CoA transferase
MMAEPYLPLRGVTVLAWEQAVSLPMATRLLADLGARVIRLDAPARGRARGRHMANDLARNKEGLALDLRSEAGQAVFKALVRKADVLCENFTPRVKRQFRLTYEDLRRERPDLIMLSLAGYGQTGRMSERPTYGPGIEAAAGYARAMGYPDDPPTRPGTIVYADNISGFYGTFAVIGALLRRRLTGRGCFIDLAMYEANAFHLAPSLLRSSLTGEDERPRGNADPAALVQDVFATDAPERWLAVTVPPAQGPALAAHLGCGDDAGALAGALRAWAAGRSAERAAAELQALGVAAAPVLNARDLLQNEQLRERAALTMVRHDRPVNGYAAHPHVASPFLFAGRPRPELREAPASGQDSRALLRELLEMTGEQIDALVEQGVVGLAPPGGGPVAMPVDEESVRRRLEWRLVADYDPDPGRTLGLPATAEVRA